MHSLNVIFYDIRTREAIEEGERLRNGKLVLHKTDDAAYVQVLLRTDFVTIDKIRYRVKYYNFDLDGSALNIYLEEAVGR